MSIKVDAKPLSTEDLRCMILDGHASLLRVIDGKLYNGEDLCTCGQCGTIGDALLSYSWDDDLCEDCWLDREEEEDHARQLRSDYLASVL